MNPGPDRPSTARGWVPVLVLVAGLLVTATSWLAVRTVTRRAEEQRFARLAEYVAHAIRARFERAAQVVQGSSAFVEAQPDMPSASEWSY